MMLPSVSILIVTHNSAHEIGACLESLARHTHIAHEVILVDNASSDASVDSVARHPTVRVVRNEENVGFAAAVNQASRLARGRYLLLLNPDTVIHDGAIDRLAAYLDGHLDVGICAPRALTADGRIRHNCFAFETPWSFFWFGVGIGPLVRVRNWMLMRHSPWDVTVDRVQEVEAVTGAAMLVRGELFAQLGGLDERFFMYCEDGDFCRRARAAGWRTILAPQAIITHHLGASTPSGTVRLNGKIGWHLVSSRYLYTHKYWGKGAMWALRWSYGMVGLLFLLVSRLIPNAAQRHQLVIAGRLLLCTPVPISSNATAHQPSGG